MQTIETANAARRQYDLDGRQITYRHDPSEPPITIGRIDGDELIATARGIGHLAVLRKIARREDLALRCNCLREDGAPGHRIELRESPLGGHTEMVVDCHRCDGDGYL